MIHHSQNADAPAKTAFDRGKTYFDLAIEKARKYGFYVEQLDSQQDRAVLYTRAGQYEKARDDLRSIRAQIPITHRLQAGIGLLVEQDDRKRIDAYFKLMGQVEFLAGTVIYNEAFEASRTQPSEDIARKMLEHYVLSIAYFNLFSGGSFTNRQTNHRIYARLKAYSRDFLLGLRDVLIPQTLEKYGLPPEIVREQFDEIFGLLIPGSRMKSWEKFSRQ